MPSRLVNSALNQYKNCKSIFKATLSFRRYKRVPKNMILDKYKFHYEQLMSESVLRNWRRRSKR